MLIKELLRSDLPQSIEEAMKGDERLVVSVGLSTLNCCVKISFKYCTVQSNLVNSESEPCVLSKNVSFERYLDKLNPKNISLK